MAKPKPDTAAKPAHASGARADGTALNLGPKNSAWHQAMRLMALAEASSGATRPALMCQAHRDLADALGQMKAYSPAQAHLRQSLRWARAMGAADLQADLQCGLAEMGACAIEHAQILGMSGASVRRARDHCRDLALEAARLAPLTTDPEWELRVLLRASDVLDRCGDHDDALSLQQQALALMGQAKAPIGRQADDDAPFATTVPAELWRPTAAGNLM